MWLITGDVCMCRKWLWNHCRGAGLASSSHDHYDRLRLQRVNVDTSATSSIFSAAGPAAAAETEPGAAAAADMM